MSDLERLIEETVLGLGYELADFELGARGLLRVFIDAPSRAGQIVPGSVDGSGVALDDCEKVSRQLSHVLMVEDVDYGRLEVSSPGLDRVLRKQRDFVRFAGHPVKVRLRAAIAGRKNFEGELVCVDPDAERWGVRLSVEALSTKSRLRPSGRATKNSLSVRGASVVSDAPPAVSDELKVSLQQSGLVEFGLSDIEQARLVPILNLVDRRSSRKDR